MYKLLRGSDHEALVARLGRGVPEFEESVLSGPVAANFNYDLNLVAIGGALAKILKSYMAKPTIRWALVGKHPDPRATHLLDTGLQPMGFREGQATGFRFDGHDLDALPADEIDLLLIADLDSAREAQLLRLLNKRAETSNGAWKIVRLRRIVDAHCQVMNQLVPRHFFTCLEPRKIAALTCLVALAPHTGVAVEAGVFLGGSTIYIAKLQRALGIQRPIFAFDTFDGLPAPTEKDGGSAFSEGRFSECDIETVRANYRAHGVDDDIQAVQGLVQDTLAASLSFSDNISFALLDTDQYAGTRAGLDAVIPKLHPRGIIVVDDANFPGPKAAIDEMLQKYPELMRCTVSTGVDLVLRRHAFGILSEGAVG